MKNLYFFTKAPPTPIQDVIEKIATGEPSFAELGLGGWSPSGLIQSMLEYMHITLGIPWWGTIVCSMFQFFIFSVFK